MIDLAAILVFGMVTWCVASEGAWGAAIIYFCTLLGGLLAMNFFEPLAYFLERNVSSSQFWRTLWDLLALVGLFAVFVTLLRMLADQLSPRFIHLHPLAYQFSRWTFGALTGFVTTAFLLAALHTAPLPREFSTFYPEPDHPQRGPVLAAKPDYQWLGYVHYLSEHTFVKGPSGRLFDGRPQEVGEQTNHIWPSFPIRYALRRESPQRASALAAQPAEGPSQPRRAPTGGTQPNF